MGQSFKLFLTRVSIFFFFFYLNKSIAHKLRHKMRYYLVCRNCKNCSMMTRYNIIPMCDKTSALML